MNYQHLLVAVDQTQGRELLIAKAHALASKFGAELSVLSVMQPIAIDALGGDLGMGMMPAMTNMPGDVELTAELRDATQQQLRAICVPLGIAAEDIHVLADHVDTGIIDTAERLGVDLIVLGHRQHTGFFAKLFSHTDQSVVGKALCDVLTVNLGKEPD